MHNMPSMMALNIYIQTVVFICTCSSIRLSFAQHDIPFNRPTRKMNENGKNRIFVGNKCEPHRD